MKTYGINKNFLGLEDDFSSLEKSKIAVLPVPYEHTTSYGKGTAKGPKAILNASHFVEFFDEEFERELCFDVGIATIKQLVFDQIYDQAALDKIEKKVKKLLNRDKFVVTLGGEHSISTAPIKAHFAKYPDMTILHFDAHSDLRDTYEESKYSHACFMARVAELFDTSKITQVGIRAQCKEEFEFIKKNEIKTFYANQIRRNFKDGEWQKVVAESTGERVYITFDVDYFDPSIMPNTGTPEPDGFLYNETLNVFRELVKQGKEIVGFDIVELSPWKKQPHTDITVASLIYKMLNYAFIYK